METLDRTLNILKIFKQQNIKEFSKEFNKVLKKYLYHNEYPVRMGALNVIKNIEIPGEFVEDLFELLAHTDNEDEKILVLNILSNNNENKEKIINKIFDSYYNWTVKVKSEALKTLSIIGPRGNEKVKQHIYNAATEETLEPIIRYGAIQALVNWKDVQAISNFLFRQKDEKIVLNTIFTLGELGKEGERYLSHFATAIFKQSSSEIKMALILALFKTGYRDLNNLIVLSLSDNDQSLLKQVIDFLAQNISELMTPSRILIKLLNVPITDEWVEERIEICFSKCLDSPEDTAQYKILIKNLLERITVKFHTAAEDFLTTDSQYIYSSSAVSMARNFIQKYGNAKISNKLWGCLTSVEKEIPSDIRKELNSLNISRQDIKGFEALLSILNEDDLKIKASLSVEIKKLNFKTDIKKEMLIRLLDIIGKTGNKLSHDIYKCFKKIYEYTVNKNDIDLFYHIAMAMARTGQPGFIQDIKKAFNFYDDPAVKKQIILVLSEINNDAALEVIFKIINNKDNAEKLEVVTSAVKSLARFFGKYSTMISRKLFDIIKDQSIDPDIRTAAVQTIVQLKTPNKNLIEFLESSKCLDDENENVRKAGLTSLAIFSEKCPEYVDQKHFISILHKKYNDQSVWIRILILVMLLKIKEEDYLIEKVKNMTVGLANYEVTTSLIDELIPLKSLKICSVLLPLLNSPDNQVAEGMVNAVSNLNEKDMKKILPELESLLITDEKKAVADEVKTTRERSKKLAAMPGYSYSDLFKHTTIMTVLFADIKGSVSLSKKLSYIHYLEILHRYHNNASSIVQKYKSKFTKAIGDGLMFTFEQPINGVIAAIEIRDHLSEDNQYRFEDEKLNVRFGLNSGLVWLKEDGDVDGQTVNIASRMESNATAGNILITENTYNEIKDHIICEKLPLIKVKGVDEPLQCYQVIEPIKDITSSDLADTLSHEEVEYTINKFEGEIDNRDFNKTLDNIKNTVSNGIANMYKLAKMENKKPLLLQKMRNYINNEFWTEFMKTLKE